MAKLEPVNPTSVAGRRWVLPQTYSFAAAWGAIPLSLAEVYPIASAMTVGFRKKRGAFYPVAITGQQPDQNLYIGPKGQWLGRLLPQALRVHPFQLVCTGDDQYVLCVDLASHCIVDAPGGEAFFEEGEMAPALGTMLDTLRQREADVRGPLAAACEAIADAGLFEAWPLEFHRDDGSSVEHGGLYRISTEALNALKAETLGQLHTASALPLIYAHRLSTYHLHSLTRLARAHGLGQKDVDLEALFGEDEDDLSF